MSSPENGQGVGEGQWVGRRGLPARSGGTLPSGRGPQRDKQVLPCSGNISRPTLLQEQENAALYSLFPISCWEGRLWSLLSG